MAMSFLVVWLNIAVVGGTSDFYYDHWQCNNYLSGETVVVRAAPGKLLEVHIRDNIAVSICVQLNDHTTSASNEYDCFNKKSLK